MTDMFTRQTSVDVYREIKDNGLLSKMRFMTYDLLYTYGDMTGSELTKKTRDVHGLSTSYHLVKRLSELRDRGVIEEGGTRICSVTGHNVIFWRVTGRMPKPIRQDIEDEIKKLDNKIEKLVLKKNKLMGLL